MIFRFDEDKLERQCEHCQEILIGKAYGPHVKKMHADIIKRKRNQEYN
jgi:ribosomal protein L37AE/L43A